MLARRKRQLVDVYGEEPKYQLPRKKHDDGMARDTCADHATCETPVHSDTRCCDHCRHPACLTIVVPEDVRNNLSLLDRITRPGLVIINGEQQSGKSHLERYISYRLRNEIGHAMVFSNSGLNGSNLDYIHPKFKHAIYGERLVRKVWSGGELTKEVTTVGRYYLQQFMNEQLKIPYQHRKLALLIVDDDITGFNDSVLIRACTQTTHLKILVIVCTQHVNKLHGAIRGQAFQIALFRLTTKLGIKAAYEAYGQDFYEYEDFRSLMQDDSKTGEHMFLWKDKKRRLPWVTLMCPPSVPPFRIGPWPDAKI